jgi:hypothetical protein
VNEILAAKELVLAADILTWVLVAACLAAGQG